MRLDQFDKLQVLVRELREYLLQIKQANYRLLKENEKLKEELATRGTQPGVSGREEINELKEENKQLRIKNKEARARLNKLISFVNGKTAHLNGVE